ncbi:MAG: hypothetical protein M3381_02860 [Actinomycetota bacterium]|nr:hypothetical protein [Actinomycetota bacterium]
MQRRRACRTRGVLDTPQTAGMLRAAAISYARTGATALWAERLADQPY